MRFSLSTAVAALPALAAAQDFQQYQAQFQDFLGNIGSYVPNPGRHDHAAAEEAKAGPLKLHTLTLENWKDTLYEPVPKDATKPEEWWVLTTGGNKTCFGHCEKVETAFKDTAEKFAVLDDAPHMGWINCDDQPILCNSWSTGAGNLWIFEMLPPPAPVNLYKKRLNMTTTTSDELVALKGAHHSLPLYESWFHPFNGQGAELGLAVPFAYFTWAFSLIPSWAFMLIVSFFSRTMMSRRMENPQQQRAQ